MNQIAQECPLCFTSAEYYTVDLGNRKNFQCPICTCFQISNIAERMLQKSSTDISLKLSIQAQKTPENHLLVITSHHQFNNSPSTSILGKYQLKSECLL